MRTGKLISRGMVGVLLLAAQGAWAQQTTGAIRGGVTDETTGAPLLLVTVVATSRALQGQQSELTDASGQFYLSNLPPGDYSLLFVYGNASVKRENVEVGLGKEAVVNARMRTLESRELVTIRERAPTIDAGSTKQGATIRQEYLRNVPIFGRTWAGVLGAAAGSQGDTYGTSFSGSTSIENSYIVDGVNTTGVTLGQRFPTQGSMVLSNFIEEIEIVTGGYNAELGRSTGGVVNVITKTGSNEFHGSLFANFNPIGASAETAPTAGSALRIDSDPETAFDFGFELGGPIVKDRVWFYVGFAPVIARQTSRRVASAQVDRNQNLFDYEAAGCTRNADDSCDADGDPATTPKAGCELAGNCEGDGEPDFDPATGDVAFEEIERKTTHTANDSYQFTGKLNLAVTPEHQGQVSLTGTSNLVRNGVSGSMGTPTATMFDSSSLNTDLSVKWTSKLFDNKTQIDALFGWHRYQRESKSVNRFLPASPMVEPSQSSRLRLSDFGDASHDFATLGAVATNPDTPESAAVRDRCTDDDPSDAFPGIQNCPFGGTGYSMFSRGFQPDILEQRFAGKLVATQRVQAAGHHLIKAGVDVEMNLLDHDSAFPGGADLSNSPGGGGRWTIGRFVSLDATGLDFCADRAGPTSPIAQQTCRYLDVLPNHGNTRNYAAFLQDGWSILPNLTINAGLRYEQQQLRYSDFAQATIDPITGAAVGEDALTLGNMLAPRIGAIYDWTREGRSKVYGSWGRFYESLPMAINDAAFAGGSFYQERWNFGMCGHADVGGTSTAQTLPLFPSVPQGCPRGAMDNLPSRASIVGSANPLYGIPPGLALVMQETAPQYMDEIVLGVEYELIADLRAGLSYQNRRMGRVIEDMSTDGGNTYFIGNPGEFSTSAENELTRRIDAIPADTTDAGEATRRAQLVTRLEAFRQTRRFDRPQRVYNALQLTAAKRFTRNFMVQGSYTYSRLEGNYPGLFSPDSGQLSPNLTSQYDLFELLGNRIGPLPFDRPHAFKIDGYYTFDLAAAGHLTAGARLRGQSGVPVTPLGAHANYGGGEAYLLRRGSGGRTAFETSADLRLAYGNKLGKIELELFVELFNVFNDQGETGVDQGYTPFAADPIIGGEDRDLPYLKSYDSIAAGENGNFGIGPAARNANYRHTDSRQEPLTGRVGATLAF